MIINVDTWIFNQAIWDMRNILDKNAIQNVDERAKFFMMWGSVCDRNRSADYYEMRKAFCQRWNLK